VRVAELGGQGAQLLHGPLALDRQARHLARLGDHHEQRHPCQVPGEDGTGEQVGEEPEARHPADQAHDADGGGEHRGDLRVPSGSGCPGQCADGRRRHERGGGLRADGELTGGPDEDVDAERSEDGPQPRHGGQARDLGVGHHLRHEVGGDGEAGHDVTPEPGALVVGEHVKARKVSRPTGRLRGGHVTVPRRVPTRRRVA